MKLKKTIKDALKKLHTFIHLNKIRQDLGQKYA